MAAKGRSDAFQLARLFWPFFTELRALFLENSVGGETPEVPEVKEGGELVGFLDREIDRRFLQFLGRHFPGIPIVSEESGGEWPPEGGTVWLVDPLDGTHNHLSGLPIFGSMAALIQGGDVVFSAVFLPVEFACGRSGFYFAGRGQGAWLWQAASPVKLVVADERDLSRAFLFLEGSSRALSRSATAQRLVQATQRSRNNLTPAWVATRIAAGALFPAAAHLMVTFKNKPWDNLPACLLIEEAGGRVSDHAGQPWSLANYADLVYSNGWLHDSALKVLAKGGDGHGAH